MASEASKAKAKIRMKAWREANKDSIKAKKKAWNEANKESVKAYQHTYHKDYRARDDVQHETWVRSLRNNYNITPETFNSMWVEQGGKCGICSVIMAPKGRAKNSVCVDHNHANGEVRGLLCRECNKGLGHFGDNPVSITSALRYLLEKGYYGSEKTDIGESK